METRTLRYFLAVAQEGNITRAAETLHVTQPTLSRQLKDLEDELGKTLLIRGKRNTTLTPEGILFRKRADEIIRLIDRTEDEIRKGEDIAGDVYLAAGETEVIREIANVFAILRQNYPNIRLRVFSGEKGYVIEQLEKGLADFGLIFGPVDLTQYNKLSLNRPDSWGVLIPEGHPLVKKTDIHPEDLRNTPLIVSYQAAESGFLQDWLGRELNDLNITATYTLILNAAKMAAGGMGCAMVLDGLVNTTGTSLVFRPLSPPLQQSCSLIWKKTQTFSPAAEKFLESMRDAF